MVHLWTWNGRYLGYRSGDELWTCFGYHVGRFIGNVVYAPNGAYLGEVQGDRLIQRKKGSGTKGYPFKPLAKRVGSGIAPNSARVTMIFGYQDFPAPQAFGRAREVAHAS